ncbi:LexA family protein [Streptomyces umbrinus]
MKSDHLTDRQEQIARFVREWIVDKGEYPTLNDIGAAMGFSAQSSVHYQL